MKLPAPQTYTLFASAVAIDCSDRQRFLVENCPDPELRKVVQELLDCDQIAESERFLNDTAPGAGRGALVVGGFVGVYRLREMIGQGGMGTVYRAERFTDFRQEVALKIGPPGLAGEIGVERFRSERQVLASLDHPNIARILDGGATPDGRPYFVMELIRGDRIDKYADSHHLSTRERVRLFRGAVEGVAYAHERGVVHRDLKPGNILVTDGGIPKVVDFGLATRPDHFDSQLTRTGDLLGTPGYLAPEQADESNKSITPSMDVFALGATLYALLTGRAPFRADSAWETIRLTREQEPVAPSRLTSGLPRDLESICLKCLEKSPQLRYSNALELFEDLKRYEEGIPVRARPITTLHRISRLARRHPLPTVLIFLLINVMIGSLIVTTVLWRRAVNHAQSAEKRSREARESLKNYTVAANKLFKSFDRVTPEDKAALHKALELQLNVLREVEEKFDESDPKEVYDTAYSTLFLANGMHMFREFELATSACEKAISVLERLKSNDSGWQFTYGYADGCAQLAADYFELGRFEDELKMLKNCVSAGSSLVERYPQSVGIRSAHSSHLGHFAGALERRGLLREAEEALSQALDHARFALEKQPDNELRYRFYIMLSVNYRRHLLNRTADIEKYYSLSKADFELFRKTIRDQEEWPSLLSDQLDFLRPHIVFLVRLGLIDEARCTAMSAATIFAEISRRRPGDGQAICHHAFFLILQSKLTVSDQVESTELRKAAIHKLQRAIEIQDATKIRTHLASALICQADVSREDAELALETIRKAMEWDPKLEGVQTILGAIWIALDDPKRGLLALDQDLKTPNGHSNFSARYLRVLALAKTGDIRQAQSEFDAIEVLVRDEWHIPVEWHELRKRSWFAIRGTTVPNLPLPSPKGTP